MPDLRPPTKKADFAHIGDFTVDNWGDRLYPLALAKLLREKGFDPSSVTHYAHRAGQLPAGAVAGAMHPHAADHDVALVGGGDLIRADYLTIAQDRLNIPSGQRLTKLNHLRGRLASAGLARGAGPWLPATGWGQHTRVGLVSVGVHPLPADQRVREAVAKVDFAYVRTYEAADRLNTAGIPSDRLLVAPDMIFAHPWLDEAEALRAEGRDIAARVGIHEPPVVFHAAAFHGWDVPSIEAMLKRLREHPLATLALGRYAGEDRLLSEAGRRARVPSLRGLKAREIMAVLAYSGCIITSSMHAAIVGAALHVPVIDAGTGKTRSALSACPAPPGIVYCSRAEVPDAVSENIGTHPSFDRLANTTPIREAFLQVLKAVDAIP